MVAFSDKGFVAGEGWRAVTIRLNSLELNRVRKMVPGKHHQWFKKPLQDNVSLTRTPRGWCIHIVFRHSTARKYLQRRWVGTWWAEPTRRLSRVQVIRGPMWG